MTKSRIYMKQNDVNAMLDDSKRGGVGGVPVGTLAVHPTASNKRKRWDGSEGGGISVDHR